MNNPSKCNYIDFFKIPFTMSIINCVDRTEYKNPEQNINKYYIEYDSKLENICAKFCNPYLYPEIKDNICEIPDIKYTISKLEERDKMYLEMIEEHEKLYKHTPLYYYDFYKDHCNNQININTLKGVLDRIQRENGIPVDSPELAEKIIYTKCLKKKLKEEEEIRERKREREEKEEEFQKKVAENIKFLKEEEQNKKKKFKYKR